MTNAPRSKRANLRDVASLAGVSVATVSRVLNTPGKVSPATRQRVQAVITDLKFVPSAAARAINSGRTRMVAALLPTLDNAIYARAVNGLEAQLAEKDMSLLVAQTGDDLAHELTRARQLVEIGAEALILAGVTHDPGLYELIARTGIPVATISYFDADNQLPTVGYDNWEVAELAAGHLADLGHRNIAVFHGPLEINDRMRRRKAALEASDLGLTFTYVPTRISMEGGCHAVEQAFANGTQGITGILCFSDVIAHGALGALQRLKITVPGDISVMGIEDLPGSKFTHPPLTSVRLGVERMGIEAAEAVCQWLETGTPPTPVYLPVELIKRASTTRVRDKNP